MSRTAHGGVIGVAAYRRNSRRSIKRLIRDQFVHWLLQVPILLLPLAMACSSGSGRSAGVMPPPTAEGGAAGARTGDESGSGGETAGVNDTREQPPTLESISPSDVGLGDAVTISGADFLPNPLVSINNLLVAPSAASARRISFVVPLELPLPTCSESVNVHVVNDVGATESVPLVVRRQAPSLNPPPAGLTAAAGGTLSLIGTGLSGASGTLDDLELSVQQVTESRLVMEIPRDAPQGKHVLKVIGPCGEVDVQLEVLAPGPRVVAIDLATVAPDGVLLVTADISDGASIDTVSVGSSIISTPDAGAFRWLNQDDPWNAVFAIRIPPDLQPGSVKLQLLGPTATSEAQAIKIIAPSPRAPEAAKEIVFAPPTASADDEPFPVSSAQPFFQSDLDPAQADPVLWSYRLEFTDDGNNNGNPGPCTRHGTFWGDEKHCPTSDEDCLLSLDCEGDFCNPITGSYQLAAADNHVDFFVDRMAPEGPEHYVGGWAQADGSPPAESAGAYLVLRSLRTGMILTIQHGFGGPPRCD